MNQSENCLLIWTLQFLRILGVDRSGVDQLYNEEFACQEHVQTETLLLGLSTSLCTVVGGQRLHLQEHILDISTTTLPITTPTTTTTTFTAVRVLITTISIVINTIPCCCLFILLLPPQPSGHRDTQTNYVVCTLKNVCEQMHVVFDCDVPPYPTASFLLPPPPPASCKAHQARLSGGPCAIKSCYWYYCYYSMPMRGHIHINT